MPMALRPPLPVPMVFRVEWPAALIAARDVASSLFPLLGSIVMSLAERLPVGSVPEQRLVSAVRDDVIHDSGGGDAPFAPAHGAKRMFGQEDETRLIPSTIVPALPCAPSAQVRFFISLALGALSSRTVERRADGHHTHPL